MIKYYDRKVARPLFGRARHSDSAGGNTDRRGTYSEETL